MLFGIIKFLFIPVSFFPRRFELLIGKFIGFILYKVIRLRRDIVRNNLLLAYKNEPLSEKELNDLEKKNYEHYGQLCMEILHIPFDAKRFAEKNVRVHNFHFLQESIDKGKGVFILSAHVGFWEIMGVVGTLYKFPLNVITKYLRIKIFNDIWVKSRQQLGINLIEESFTAKHILKAIKKGEVIGFVLDQFMGPPVGIKVDFFDQPAWTIASLAWFVQKTGAAVVPTISYRDSKGKYDLIINKEIGFESIGNEEQNIKHNTQRYSKICEDFIKKKPEQWLWLHKRWKRTKEDDVQGE